MKLPKLIVILGQTATGKTEIAIRLAKKFNGEIVSADSRQIYKQMNIGTSKPTKKELSAVPHSLINIMEPDQAFNVVIFKKLAMKAIKSIHKNGKLPFLVGGTGLYIKAVVNNIDFPKIPPNKKMRKNLEKKTEKDLLVIYQKLDPEGAGFIEKNNKRRLIRAIEVSKATGKPFWEQRKEKGKIFDTLQLGIKTTQEELKERIERRVKKMIKLGLEKEVKKLIKKYGKAPSLQTIGYQEWNEYFEGKIIKEKVKELIGLHTLQFSKRQMTWFKKDKKIAWVKGYNQAEKKIKDFLS